MKHYHVLIGLLIAFLLCLISHIVAYPTAVSDANEFLLLGMEGPPLHAWTRCIGGSNIEVGYSVQQTTDGGYVVTGYTSSSDGDMTGAGYHSNTDAFLAKYTSTGTLVWLTCIGGSGADYGNSVQQTTDGEYIIAGYTSSSDGDMAGAGYHGGGNPDAFLAKYTSTGTRVWVTCIGGSGTDYGNSVQQTTDGGYVVTGFTYSSDGDMTGAGFHSNADAFLAKYTSTGTLVWLTCIGGSGYDFGESLQQTTDGEYIIAGYTSSSDGDLAGAGFHSGDDAFLAKYTSSGTRMWVTCIGGSNTDQGYSVQQTTDGGYVVAGDTTSSDGDMSGAGYHGGGYHDAFLAKYTSTGTRVWVKCIGGSNDDYGYSLQQTTDGGFVVAGHTLSSDGDMSGAGHHGGYDAFLAKYTSTGVRLWVTCIGGSYYDYGYSVQQTTDGGYVVAGSTWSSDGDMTGAGYHSSTDTFLSTVFTPTYKPPSEIGVFRGAGQWFLDRNGNHAWDGAGIDVACTFGKTGDLPVVTDWNTDNRPEIGIFRDGQWYVDFSRNYHWDGTRIDRVFTFGMAGDIPVIGDWNLDLDPDIGVFRGAGMWYLDMNGNHRWDGAGPGLDGVYTFGISGDTPVIGDWDRDGHPEIGVFRAANWYVDYNRNYAWDGSVTDRVYSFGLAGDRPVTGDWNGDGIMEIGVFRAAKWYVDLNGNNFWDGTGTGKDAIYSFGLSGDRPVAGEWT